MPEEQELDATRLIPPRYSEREVWLIVAVAVLALALVLYLASRVGRNGQSTATPGRPAPLVFPRPHIPLRIVRTPAESAPVQVEATQEPATPAFIDDTEDTE